MMLHHLRARVEAGCDGAIYGDRSRALWEIESLLATPSVEGVKFLFLPKANLQELAMKNG